ncbi:MAG: hypothetical protein ACOYLS_14435 [Polymorphobacter sp.]
MRLIPTLLIAAIATGLPALPAAAKKKEQVRYEYDGHYYDSLAECQEKKRKAKKDGTIVGAAVAGVGAAVLGANLGETALIAGGGALVGNQLGKSKKC